MMFCCVALVACLLALARGQNAADCGGRTCPQYTSCAVNATTGQSACVPDCGVQNGGCPVHQRCRLSNAPSFATMEGNEDDQNDGDGSHDHSQHGHSQHGHSQHGHSRDGSHGHTQHGNHRHNQHGNHGHNQHGGHRDGSHHHDQNHHNRSHHHDGHHHHNGGHHDGRHHGNHHHGDHGHGGRHHGQDAHQRDGFYTDCVEHPYVLCNTSRATRQCSDEFTYCLQRISSPHHTSCIPSCLSSNGGCEDHQECVTRIRREPRMQCIDRTDLSVDCLAGQVLNQCGAACQETCEQRVSGERFTCDRRCGRPACVCPAGLVLFRDRCVDPRLCHELLQRPPPIDPLPLIDDAQYLFSLFSPGASKSGFVEEEFLSAVRKILEGQGLPEVTVQLHGIYEDGGLQVVVALTGDGISAEFASTLADNSDQFPMPVDDVEPVDVDRVGCDSYWTTSRIVIVSVAGGVSVLVVIAAVLVAIMCCLRRKQAKNHHKKLIIDVHNSYEVALEKKAKLEFI